jgi:hypothetical protein
VSVGGFLTVAGLGIFHGLNPAMGWLFAVALGLQASASPAVRRRAALTALPPIAAGHLVSVGAVTSRAVTIGAGTVLVGMGLWRLLSQRHFRWVGMKLTPWELGTWSLLMSSVHGAGLMLVPVLATHQHAAVPRSLGWSAVATLLHTATMVVTAAVVAVVVLQVLGLGVLRKAWINVDRIWAVALIGAGAATALTR